MPRPISVINSFTSGELSPGAFGRTDLQKWNNGLTCSRNFMTSVFGGAVRRPGTRFVCETKYSQFTSRLIPFEPSATSAYIIEAGCQYLRLFKNNAVLGSAPDLVANGSFGADLSGWTTPFVTAPGTVDWSAAYGGSVLFTASSAASFSSLQQDITVTAGIPYTFTFTIPEITAGFPVAQFELNVGYTSQGTELLDLNDLHTAGTYSYTITSPTSLISIIFFLNGNQTGFKYAYLDNVSLRANTGLEITTAYNYGQINDIDTVQSADELYFLHQCVKTAKLQRYGDGCLKFVDVTFTPPPSVEYGDRPATEVQAGATSGNNVTFTAFNGPTFLASDVGREIQMVSGCNAGSRAGIKSVTNSLAVVANICIPFLNTNVNCNGSWKISGSPLAAVTPAAKSPVGTSTTLTANIAAWRGTTFTTSTDCGKFAHVNGGTFEITCVTSSTVARALIHAEATSVTRAEAGAWTLEEALWSCIRGYAQTGDFLQDRLWLDAVFRVCGSKIGDYENFGTGVLDDDAVVFGINTKTINAIRAIVGARVLQVLTVGGEHAITGGVSDPITPTNVQVSNETRVGSSGIPPIRVNDATIFVSRFGKHVHEFTIPRDAVTDIYSAPDLLLLASHLTATTTITGMAYQREPISVLWFTTASGLLLSCTYRREENVVSWASHDTCGTFESVAVIPHPDGDREQVWVIVNRNINGSTKRYVEYLDDSTLTYDRRLTDSSVIYNGTACSIMQGVSHLNGMTVQVQADGRFVGTCVVSSGLVGLTTAATKIEVGLPYTSELITLPPEISMNGQSLQPMRKRWAQLFARAQDSCGLAWRTSTSTYTCLPSGNLIGPGVRDYEDKGFRGDFHDARIWVKQDQPLPANVLMVGGVLDVGEA